MMPKGVEHTISSAVELTTTKLVRIPMMPKGVEHMNGGDLAGKSVAEGENSDDAERR